MKPVSSQNDEILKAFDEADQAIRRGQHAQLKRWLQDITRRKLPRHVLARAANLARRVDEPAIALRLLNPVVRVDGRSGPGDATGEEQAEYGAALIRMGAGLEGLKFLKNVGASELPQVHLYRALGEISRWEYHAAIPHLKRLLAHSGSDDYLRKIARVNLAAALVFERRHAAAESVIRDTLRGTEAESNRLLHANLLELAAQNAIFSGAWEEAREHLGEAERLLPDPTSIYGFFIRKWRAVLELLSTQASRQSRQGLLSIRQEAARRKRWESIRDCDYHLSYSTVDQALLTHLFFGTPYLSIRERLSQHARELLPRDFGFPDTYGWNIGTGRKKGWIDASSGENSNSQLFLKRGQALHRFFLSLSRDFYKPRRLVELYAETFPDEFFSPFSSPNRVHQLCRKLKAYLKDARLPLTVTEDNGFYRLGVLDEGTIRVICAKEHEVSKPGDPHYASKDLRTQSLLRKFRARQGSMPFQATEFAKACGISHRSALRHLQVAVSLRWIHRSGLASQTSYIIAECE